ncbi:MAG: type II secretion system F family protein [Methylophilaceae bacterium]
MASFTYTALNVDGKETKGVVDALDSNTATALLRERGLFIVTISQGDNSLGKGTGGVKKFLANNRSVSKRDLVFFFKQMAFMLRAGLPMLHALKISANQFSGRLHYVIPTLIRDVERGSALSTAMKKQKKEVFPPIAANMVFAGESTGAIDAVMLRIAEHLEKKLALRSQTINAMIYPAFVILAAIVVIIGLLTVIIPKFAKFLAGRGKKLPEPTQLLIDLSDFVVTKGGYIFGFTVILAIMVALIYATAKGRLVIDTLLLKLPVVGKLLNYSAMAEFSWSVSMMLRSGLTAFESLKITSNVISNRLISNHLKAAAEKIKMGRDLSSSITGKGVPSLVPQMTMVGEQTGSLDQILHELGGFYEERLEVGVKRMTSLIEPVLILVIGTIVGFVYYAFFMALFALAS